MDKVLLVIAALALVLRLYGLGDQSIWADELQRIVWSKGYEFKHVLGLLPSELEVRLAPRDLPTAIGILVGHNPPLYGTVLHGWMVLTGSASDFVLRLPSVFFGVVTVIAVYFAILEIGGTSAARWGSTLIAVWPFHVFYAQEINHYTLGTALVAGSFVVYFRRMRAPSVQNGIGLSACVLAGLLTHYFTGIAFAFQALGMLVYVRQAAGVRERLQRLWPYAASLSGFMVYAVALRDQLREMTDPSQVGHFGGLASFLDQLRVLGSAHWLGEAVPSVSMGYGLAFGAAVLAVAAAGAWQARDDRGLARVLALIALGPTVAILALYWIVHVNSLLWPRYHLLFTPGIVIAAAIVFRNRPTAALFATVPVLAIACIGLHALYSGFAKESWKQVAVAIDARAGDGDSVVVYRPNLVYSLAHYLHRALPLYGLIPDASLECTTMRASRGDAVWLVSAWQEGPESTEAILRSLRLRYQVEESIPLPGDRVGTRLFHFSQPVARSADERCKDG